MKMFFNTKAFAMGECLGTSYLDEVAPSIRMIPPKVVEVGYKVGKLFDISYVTCFDDAMQLTGQQIKFDTAMDSTSDEVGIGP
jgi:hypothetical protein